jgi:hypothetical protein
MSNSLNPFRRKEHAVLGMTASFENIPNARMNVPSIVKPSGTCGGCAPNTLHPSLGGSTDSFDGQSEDMNQKRMLESSRRSIRLHRKVTEEKTTTIRAHFRLEDRQTLIEVARRV